MTPTELVNDLDETRRVVAGMFTITPVDFETFQLAMLHCRALEQVIAQRLAYILKEFPQFREEFMRAETPKFGSKGKKEETP